MEPAVIGGAAVIATVVAFVVLRGSDDESSDSGRAVVAATPPRSTIDQASVAAPRPDLPPQHAGSEACARCHKAQYDEWHASVHRENAARPSPETVLGDFEKDNVFEFAGTRSRMYRQGNDYFLEFTEADGQTWTRRIDWVSGTIRHQVYLHRMPDGRLQVMPTYWNVEEGKWLDNVEGSVIGAEPPLRPHDPAHWSNYLRTWTLACMECHSSQPRKYYDPVANTYDSKFDPAINCESCHGPGVPHAEAWTSLKGRVGAEAKDPIERLGRYDLDRSVEVCAQCHSAKTTFALGYMAGDDFYDYFVPDLWQRGRFFADGRSASLNYRSDPRRVVRVEAWHQLVALDPGLARTTDPQRQKVRDEYRTWIDDVRRDDPRLKRPLAMVAAGNDDIDRAEQLFRERAQLLPRDTQAQDEYIQLLMRRGKQAEAARWTRSRADLPGQ